MAGGCPYYTTDLSQPLMRNSATSPKPKLRLTTAQLDLQPSLALEWMPRLEIISTNQVNKSSEISGLGRTCCFPNNTGDIAAQLLLQSTDILPYQRKHPGIRPRQQSDGYIPHWLCLHVFPSRERLQQSKDSTETAIEELNRNSNRRNQNKLQSKDSIQKIKQSKYLIQTASEGLHISSHSGMQGRIPVSLPQSRRGTDS